jgi:hypothetical protein
MTASESPLQLTDSVIEAVIEIGVGDSISTSMLAEQPAPSEALTV